MIEIAYVVAKEEMPFTKFVPIAKLEKRHGVELGQTYLNDHACADFVDTIAEIYEEELNQVYVPFDFRHLDSLVVIKSYSRFGYSNFYLHLSPPPSPHPGFC